VQQPAQFSGPHGTSHCFCALQMPLFSAQFWQALPPAPHAESVEVITQTLF
jgi:hypothetical protein